MGKTSSRKSQSQSNPLALNFELHPRQGDALHSTATELLYGGAASGGKSHLCRVLAILWALEIPGIQIYFFRRLYDDLIKNHLEGPTGFRAMLATWMNTRHPKSPLIGKKLADVVDGEIRFWNGSKIFLCHLQHQKDLTKYYGPDFHVLFLEEATQFSEFMIRFLRSRLRIPDTLKIPDKYKKPKEEWKDPNVPDYYFPRAVYTSNPGGVGHAYLKKGFLDDRKPYQLHTAKNTDGGHVRQFIPARVDDNPSVNRENVKLGLAGLPPALVDAMLNGNWNAVIGAFFPEIDTSGQMGSHVIRPFLIPEYWPRIMAMDWGACGDGDPFAIGWGAVSDGSIPLFPRGSIIVYRNYYGKGMQKVTASMIAEGVRQRELKDPPIVDRVAGGDIQEKKGSGPSVFEKFAEAGIYFRRADMRRVSGWQETRERLVGKNGVPMIYWFDECLDELETMMQLQHDQNNPNDAAAGEDHYADMIRYMVMSRPWVKDTTENVEPWKNYNTPTIDDLWAQRDKMLNSERRF